MKDLQPWQHSNFFDAYNEGNLIEELFGSRPLANTAAVSSIILGHSQGSVHDTYFHKQIGSLKAAVDKIY